MKPRFVLLLLLGLCASLPAETARLLILHTNDLHDHVRSGYNGVGGLSYVAGYVRSVRAEHPEALVLDAGDVTEKGDLVAHRSHGELTFEALRRIGYDAVTIGNHDNDAGLDGLRRFERTLGQPLLCLNRVDTTGQSLFERARIVSTGPVKVGLIGMIKQQSEGVLSLADSGAALAREAARLRPQVDVIIAVCHEYRENCRAWSRQAPDVDLFVTGHEHDLLRQAERVPETGAWLVQAGSYAEWVGRVELEVDLDRHRPIGLTSEVVEMRHDRIPVDAELAAWVREREAVLAPEANAFVLENREPVTAGDLAWLAAEGLRRAAGAEIGFCHGGQILRATLPQGSVDVNAVFLTGGQRGEETLRLQLTGAEIEAYLVELAERGPESANWAGFGATLVRQPDGSHRVSSTLEPDRLYSVIMPRLEWRSRFLMARERQQKQGLETALTQRATIAVEPSPVTFTSALTPFLRELAAAGASLRAEAAAIPTRDARPET